MLNLFQSTLPREERLCLCCLLLHFLYFNPRSHERSDYVHLNNHRNYKISIHAPTRGATSVLVMGLFRTHISIHAPTRGATFFPLALPFKVCISIHAPTRGATSSSSLISLLIDISIHAPTRGATGRAYHTRASP